MGRRKKEPRSKHRETIAAAASQLFMAKGIDAVSMNEIAKTAGYSKATIYVYFQSKEEIVGLLVLDSMKKLDGYLSLALQREQSAKARYDAICDGLVRYQEEFPFYFNMVLDKINIDFEDGSFLPEEKETYQIGESINEKLREFLISGMESGDLRKDLEILPAIFHFWGMLSGLIRLAAVKEGYIECSMRLSKTAFLKQGFDMLYRSIAALP